MSTETPAVEDASTMPADLHAPGVHGSAKHPHSAVPTTAPPKATHGQEVAAKVLIGTYAAAAVVSAALMLARFGRPGRQYGPIEWLFGMLNIPLSSTPIAVVVLAVVSGALARRKRVALFAVGIFQVLGALISVKHFVQLAGQGWNTGVSNLLGVLDGITSVLAVLIGFGVPFLLYWMRPAFSARVHSRSWWRAIAVVVSGVILTGVLAALLLLAFKVKTIDLDTFLAQSFQHALGLEAPRLLRSSAGQAVFLASRLISAMLVITLGLGLYVLLRPSARAELQSPQAEFLLRRQLLTMKDPDSLSYFATRRDKKILVSSDGQASLGYRLMGSVCLVAGDPIGERSSWPMLISEWMGFCREYGWTPAVLSASEEGARAYLEHGLSVLSFGDEAILEPDSFTLNSEAMAPVRHAVNRARRSGLEADVQRMGSLNDEQRANLAEAAGAWRTERERGFSMALGRIGDPADSGTVAVVAHDDAGEALGLLTFVPWGSRGLSLDLMLRHPKAPNGTTELMVSSLMAWCQENGIREVSLNFAMFRSLFTDAERLGASPAKRLNSGVLGFLDRFVQLQSLYKANEKYHPRWQPRYALFDGALTLPRVVLAAGAAEGFLPTPFRALPLERSPLDAAQLRELEQLAEKQRTPAVEEVIRTGNSFTRLRLEQTSRLEAAGMPAYPVGSLEAMPLSQMTKQMWDPAQKITLTGRVKHVRRHGGVVFTDLTEGGANLQVLFQEASTAQFDAVRSVGTGDLLVVTGRPGASNNGTVSLLASSWSMAAKALHPLPYRGGQDAEGALRRRSTEIAVNPQLLQRLKLRSNVVRSLRRTLDAAGFTEVETPMLNTVQGGANARPFRTYINAYGVDLTMRIAPELQLKRLVAGGMGPVFELGRNFRNEGADATHNPEFTALEVYEPFGDYTTMRELTEQLIKDAATAAFGAQVLPLKNVKASGAAEAEAELVDVSGPWPVVPVLAAVSDFVGREVSLQTPLEGLRALCNEHEVPFRPEMGAGALIEELYGELVEPGTIRPTFYTDFPVETSPLAGPHRSEVGLAERWDLVANGMEIGTAYSELTDPREQRRRLTEQSLKAAHGDAEAMSVDEDFLYSLETGMPPTGGMGLGVDRLVMLLTGTTIREVLTFPFVRPLK